ncbi:DinB family protein [bacterium]|nr:DinB family protein [candidate division CSSED10-310 bacterium]
MKATLIAQLQIAKNFFNNTTSCLTESDSDFIPSDGMFSAAQQIAHTAQTVDWFISGAFDSEGFDMDFEKHLSKISNFTSLQAARKWLTDAFEKAVEKLRSVTEAELMTPIPEGPVMGGLPRAAVINAIVDHTAHHRGALSVYCRLLGKVPKMPYGD